VDFLNGTTSFDPTSTYTVSGITTVSGGTASFGNNATTNALRLSGGNIAGTGTLTASGVGTWTAGGMQGIGTTVFGPSSALTISGTDDKGLGRNVVSNGLATWTTGRMNVANGTFINNGVFDAQADNFFESFGGINAYNNAGTFTRTVGTGSANFNIPFNNSGTVIVSSGILALNGGGASSGTFIANASSMLRFGGGTQVATGARVSGAGTVDFSGGTTSFDPTSIYAVSGITTASGGTASFGNNATTNALRLSGGNIAGAGTLTDSGVGTWTDGSMSGAGTTVFGPSSVLTISGPNDKGLSRNVVSNGVATWTTGRMNVAHGTFINNGVFDAQADNFFESFGGINAYNNAGTFTRTVGTGSATFNIPFNNSGTVIVSSGTLVLNAGGASSGTFVANASSMLRFGGGTQVATGARVSGAGTVDFLSGTTSFDLTSSYAVTGMTNVSGGTASFGNNATTNALSLTIGNIAGAGTLTASGLGTWIDGSMTGAGTTIFGPLSALTISGPNEKGLSRNVVTNGVATWTTGRMNVGNGTFTNNGVFDAEADNFFESFGGINAYNNAGTFTRTVGTGSATFNIPFNNSGTVLVSSGTLALSTGGSSSGVFTAASGSTVRFAGGHVLSGTSAVSGAGTIQVSPGTNTFGGSFNVSSTHVVNGATLRLAPGANVVLRTQTLLIDGAPDAWTARVNLSDGDAIIDYTGGSPIATIQNQIRQGYNGGPWNGNGITTGLGDASHGLGYADNAVLGRATFSGQSVDSSSVLIKFTYFGDTDLNGQVDVADLGNLASHWQTSSDWLGGDLDYSGFVNVNDLGLLASNWQAGVGNPLGPESLRDALAGLGLPTVSVPEPAAVGLLASAALLLRRRRK
jgi:hypothetical protein